MPRASGGRGAEDMGGSRFLAAAVVGAVLLLVTLVLLRRESIPGTALARASYDLSYRLRPRPPSLAPDSSPLIAVLLDRRSYETLGGTPAQPLDRRHHARLLDRLRQAGAHVVVFDILFDQAGDSVESDQAFADAIRRHGKVVLAAEWHRSERALSSGAAVAMRGLGLPATNFLEAAAGYGFAFLNVDPDFVPRRHFPGFLDRDLPSLTWSTALLLDAPITRAPGAATTSRWLSYYGPPLSVPNVSYCDALDPAQTADALFRDKVVLVGTRPTAGQFDERRDEWRSPVSRWGDRHAFMPGVEVHATELLNLLRNDWWQRPPPTLESFALGACALALAFLLVPLRPVSATLAGGGILAATLITASWLITRERLWFPWLIVVAVQLPVAATSSFLIHTRSWLRQRRRFQQRVREQAELLDKARDAILVSDFAGLVTYANPAARQLYGWTEVHPDPASQPIALEGSRAHSLLDLVARTRQDGEWSGELAQRDASGSAITVETRATLIRDAQGVARQILFINTDITERKRLQDQFLRAQRRESIGALAGGMAHDLNNALSPILMGIQTLKMRAADDSTRRMLDIMESNTKRGAGMIRQVLLFSRGQDALVSTVHLPGLLRDLEAVLRQSFPKSIDLSVLAPEDLWPLQANPTQLQQILLNLCLNARDAMPSGGRLTLAGDNADLSTEELADLPGLAPGRHVMLLVSDSGPGIPPEIQARLFEPFFTTKPAGLGTGLGLATVASLVKAHRGALRLRSQPGEGTTFEIYLPALDATTASALHPATAPAAAMDAPRGLGECLLVADDDLSIRDLLREGLTQHGYRVLGASHGVEALALARQHATDLRLAIVDWRLTGIGESRLAVDLHHQHPALPLLVVSGALPGEDALAAWSGSPPPMLSKPFPMDDLLREVARRLGR